MDIRATAIPEVKVLTPRRFGDHRGYFCETWSAAAHGRGRPRPRLRAGQREPFDAGGHPARAALPGAALRPGQAGAGRLWAPSATSPWTCAAARPTFGRWVAEEISAANGAQFLVPRGFLHGFVTLTASTLVLYKVDNPYDAASDGGVLWSDADLGVDWGLPAAAVVLSDKDRGQPAFRDWVSPFEYGVNA